MRSTSENNLRLCLKAVTELPKENRQRVVTRLDTWRALDSTWQGILLVAIQETVIPESDSGQKGSPVLSMRRNIGRRGGKSRRGNVLVEKLKGVNLLMDSSSGPDAFRLASLLIHKTLNPSDWDDGSDVIIEELRTSCMSGVHPVWAEMAEKTPILAQFAFFPTIEVGDSEEDIGEEWIKQARINLADTKSLGNLLAKPIPVSVDARCEVEIRRLSAILCRRNYSPDWLASNVESSLLEMTGQSRIISSIILSVIGHDDARDSLSKAAEENPLVANLVSDMKLFLDLSEENNIDWEEAIRFSPSDELGKAIRVTAWSKLPLEIGRELAVPELEEGLQLLENAGVDDNAVRWSLVVSHYTAGNNEEAKEVLSGLRISKSDHLQIARLVGSSVVDVEWMIEQIQELSIEQLVLLVEDKKEDTTLRIHASKQLQKISPIEWINCLRYVIPLLVTNAEIAELTHALRGISSSDLDYPWEVILVHHLHPATSDSEISNWLNTTHSISVEVYEATSPPKTLSKLSSALLRLLEGSNVDLNVIAQYLPKDSFQAFRACRHSLADPEMLIRESELVKLAEGVRVADISSIEKRLFESVVENVTLNRAAFDMQRNEAGLDEGRIESLISSQRIRQRLLIAIKEMVLEHQIPVPSLIQWFQENDPNSVYHHLAKAAVSAHKGNRLEAARAYSHAGNARSELEFNDCISLLRTSLIHFAHAENWVETRSVLANNNELSPSLTPGFKLYLQVQYYASQNQQDKATQMLLDAAIDDVPREVFNDDGELEMRLFREPSPEKLHRMTRYPVSRGLPPEPFQGRIRAALRQCENRGRRHSRVNDIERQYNENLRNEDINGLYEIASEQSEINPLRGLSLLDRAIHSGKIMKSKAARLRDSMLSLYQMHSEELPVSDRRLLRNLSLQNLVIVDTNILIDALQSRIADSLEMSGNIRLDLVGNRHFHHMLLHFSKQNKLKTCVTETAETELRSFAKKNDRLRGLFDKMYINPKSWSEQTSSEKIEKLISRILNDFNTWKPPQNVPIHKSFEQSEIEKFLFTHHKIYEKLTDLKAKKEPLDRTIIDGHPDPIFPENGDIQIMLTCANLAGKSLPKIGTITVASQDSDFTHVARAFEEEFGFTIVKNTKQLREQLAN